MIMAVVLVLIWIALFGLYVLLHTRKFTYSRLAIDPSTGEQRHMSVSSYEFRMWWPDDELEEEADGR